MTAHRSPSVRGLFILQVASTFGSLSLICWPLLYPVFANRNESQSTWHTAAELVEMAGGNPVSVEFEPIELDIPVEQDELLRYVALMTASGPNESRASVRRSRKLHTGRLVALFGETPEWLIHGSPPAKDHLKLGEEDFSLSWRGLEAIESEKGRRSEHRDQTLSTLAELGVTLDTTIEIKDGSMRVADLLAASLNEFHLGQKEISWTATAYALYLPPQTTWWNRFGEQFSFDALAQEMMSRKLDRESCQGIHLVMTLTKLLKVDREFIVLSPQVRSSLHSYLRGKLSEAVGTQLEDGSWPMAWSASGFSGTTGYTPRGGDTNRVIVAGHLLEWFHLLPKDIKPPAKRAEIGALWLLQNLRKASETLINEEFCPYTHAVLSLCLARNPG